MAGLQDLYKEIIMDHYKNPRNRGELPPPAFKVEGFNPLCGDEIVLYLSIDGDGVIADITTGGQGCSISQSSASMMTAAVKGKTVEEAQKTAADFKAMMGISVEDDTEATDAHGDDPEMAASHEVAEQEIAAAKAAAGDGDAMTVADTVEKPDLSMGDLSALRGVKKFPVRIKCAVLSWNTLLEAIDESQSG